MKIAFRLGKPEKSRKSPSVLKACFLGGEYFAAEWLLSGSANEVIVAAVDSDQAASVGSPLIFFGQFSPFVPSDTVWSLFRGYVTLTDARKKFMEQSSYQENAEKAKVTEWIAHENAIFDLCWIKIKIWDTRAQMHKSINGTHRKYQIHQLPPQ